MTSRFVLPLADVGAGLTPSSGAQLFFYETGTTTPKDTYSDSAGSIPNANPVIANSVGVFPDTFVSGSYKVVLKNSSGVQQWAADPVSEFAPFADGGYVTKTELAAAGGELLVGSFDTVALALAGITAADEGKRVSWLGYYAASDGGSGWGIVKTGAHIDDGGSILSAGASLYIEQNLTKTVNIKKFGARAGFDSAPNINKCQRYLSGIGGGVAVIPVGEFLLETFDTGVILITPQPNVSMCGYGRDSILKVADGLNNNGVGGFHVIHNDDGSSGALEHISYKNFTIDFNGANNLWPASPSTQIVGNHGIRMQAKATAAVNDVEVSGVWFKDNPGSQNVLFTTSEVSGTIYYPENIKVRKNLFTNPGPSLAGNDHITDHSSVFIHAKNVKVQNNEFVADNLLPETTTAIEVQIQHSAVTGNICKNFSAFMNASAQTRDFIDVDVSDNKAYNVRFGIYYWSGASFEFREATFSNNNFVIASDAPDFGGGFAPATIDSTLRDITIQGGSIRQIVGAGQSGKQARGIYLANNKGVTIDSVRIRDMSGRGIQASNGLPSRSMDDVKIINPDIVDCCRGGVSGVDTGILVNTVNATVATNAAQILGGIIANRDASGLVNAIELDGQVNKMRIEGVQFDVTSEDILLTSFSGIDLEFVSGDKVTAIGGAYTVKISDSIIRYFADGGGATATLPPASGLIKKYTFKKTDTTANAFTIAADGSDTIDGSATYAMTNSRESVTIASDGVNQWRVISGYAE